MPASPALSRLLSRLRSWDLQCQFKVRVVCARPYHALFMHNMLIRPSEDQLHDFGVPDFTIYNAGGQSVRV